MDKTLVVRFLALMGMNVPVQVFPTGHHPNEKKGGAKKNDF